MCSHIDAGDGGRAANGSATRTLTTVRGAQRGLTGHAAHGFPSWFRAALDVPATVGLVTSHGARLAYRSWGDADDPGIVLVHGSAANARWWDHVAPLLAIGRHVVAIDLSGHGDSEWRASYSQATWADELRAIVHDVMRPKPVVVAHSMGGKVAYRAALHGMDREVGALVLVDSNIGRQLRPHVAAAAQERALRPRRVYPDVQSVVAAFRPHGVRPGALPPHFAQHVGTHSTERVPGGWAWKSDPAVAGASADLLPEPSPLACPTKILRAAFGSTIDDVAAQTLTARCGTQFSIDVVPRSGHHMMFDGTARLVSALQTMLTR